MTETRDTQALIEQCRNGDSQAQLRAIGELERAGAKEAVDVILPLLTSTDESVRGAAADALGQLGDERAAQVGPALEPLLTDVEDLVRNSAAEALGFLRYVPARPALERALRQDTDWVVRASAAWALGELADVQALPALEAALDDEVEPVRGYVATAIEQLGDATQLPMIRRRLADETHPSPRADLIAVALRFGDASAFDDLLALAGEVFEEEYVYHVLRIINKLLEEPTPAVVLERGAELEPHLVEFARRQERFADWAAELRERLADRTGSAKA